MGVPGIFIFGYMHCGTTLLQRILSKHEAIYCKQKELKFIENLARIKDLYPNLEIASQRRNYVAFCFYVIENAIPPSSRLEDFPLTQYLEKSRQFDTESLDHLSIFFEAFQFLARAHRYWMDGSPNNIFRHREIRQRCPDARFITIVRDVRDVIASKKKRKEGVTLERYRTDEMVKRKKLEKTYSCVIDSLSWKSTYNTYLILSLKDPKTLLIRYEDLTSDPKSVVLRICEFLDLQFSDCMLEISFANRADDKQIQGGIFLNSGNYVSILKGSEIFASQVITKRLLNRFHYRTEKVSPIAKLQSVFHFLKFLPQLVKRIWYRYRFLGFKNFLSFVRFNLLKVSRGIMKAG